MSYLNFDKTQLVNLEYSLSREILRTNRAGSYSSSTIIGCNTRKYHGLLICPVPELDNERFVFLSSLDETVVQHDAEFNLGIHQFDENIYQPKGHKYVIDFDAETLAKTTYRVGGVILTKESLLVDGQEQLLIRYTLEEAHSATKLRFRPFLAFRNIHQLSKANMFANTRVTHVKNGVSSALYQSMPALFMQFSKNAEFVTVPDWYFNIEYAKEQERGYDFREDLFVPGFFEVDIRKGESIIFSASLREEAPATFKRKFEAMTERRLPRASFAHCLTNAAHQFIVKQGKKVGVIAGYPWFGAWGRDTFISLPGLTLAIDEPEVCKVAIDTQVSKMRGGLFPNMGSEENPAFNSVDAPLWFFWTLQRYGAYIGNDSLIWKGYGKYMKQILESFRNGSLPYNILMHDNGLVFAGQPGVALTWMDAVVSGEPVTPRMGYPVEINALWFNAVSYTLALAKKGGDKKFVAAWETVPELIAASFVETFWSEDKGYLADVVCDGIQDWSVRPNQVIAVSLPYVPVSREIQKEVLDLVQRELLTPRGLRTLSPQDERYEPVYEGDQDHRDRAYHQGTVWPWLLQPFGLAWLSVHGKSGVAFVKSLIGGFEEEMTQHGIASVSEIYNGNPPHLGRGATSQAWSVAALLMLLRAVEQYEKD